MKRFKVEQVVLCEVRVWGYVEAEHMGDAMAQAAEIGTGDAHDYEIISDIDTVLIEIKEEKAK
jgi:hypothetical protein